jgi:Tfp pilus assembly protein PilV
MIIEVVVTGMVVAMIGLGLFSGLEALSHGSANNRNRSVAVTLAQQDQDRMRAYKATALSNYRANNTYVIGGVTYTVASKAQWVSDSSGVISCTSGTTTASYINITSTVTWTRMGGAKPIKESSLFAPPPGSFSSSQGVLSVQIKDRLNNALPGIPVNVGAPANAQDTTDSLGCAVFSGLNAGNYDISFAQPGYVDTGGNNAVSKTASVVAETASVVSFQYDVPGSIAVTFDTDPNTGPAQAAQSQSVTVAHTNMPSPQRKTFDPSGTTPLTTVNATSLFPFTTAYGIYAGACANNDPATYGQTAASQIVAPNGSHAVTARVPAINVNVKKQATGTPDFVGANVKVYATSSGCSETYPVQTTNASGRVPDPGYPYGDYIVCADGLNAGSIRRVFSGTIQNRSAAGTATQTLTIPSSGSTGTCP